VALPASLPSPPLFGTIYVVLSLEKADSGGAAAGLLAWLRTQISCLAEVTVLLVGQPPQTAPDRIAAALTLAELLLAAHTIVWLQHTGAAACNDDPLGRLGAATSGYHKRRGDIQTHGGGAGTEKGRAEGVRGAADLHPHPKGAPTHVPEAAGPPPHTLLAADQGVAPHHARNIGGPPPLTPEPSKEAVEAAGAPWRLGVGAQQVQAACVLAALQSAPDLGLHSTLGATKLWAVWPVAGGFFKDWASRLQRRMGPGGTLAAQVLVQGPTRATERRRAGQPKTRRRHEEQPQADGDDGAAGRAVEALAGALTTLTGRPGGCVQASLCRVPARLGPVAKAGAPVAVLVQGAALGRHLHDLADAVEVAARRGAFLHHLAGVSVKEVLAAVSVLRRTAAAYTDRA
jgi:hypothetical protein